MAQVRVKRGRVHYVLELVNISSSGALIRMGSLKPPVWLKPGKQVSLAVFVSGELFAVQLAGTIVRVEKRQRGSFFAVEFGTVSGKNAEGLKRLIGYAASGCLKPPPLPAQPPPLIATEIATDR